MSQDRKIVHDLPLEELIKIATESKEEVVADKLSEATKFIYSLGIKQGKEKISAQLVYYTYKQWRGWKNKKQPKSYFFRDFSKYFDSTRTKDGIHYLLNPKPFDLTADAYWQMRRELRLERSRKKTSK